MPDINWPEVLVALVLGAIVTELGGWLPVSYTHLTLPTIYSV